VKDENPIPKVDWEKRVTNFNFEIWTLFFDGSKSQERAGVGLIFIDPGGKHSFLSCRLEFKCTNNTTSMKPWFRD
jgi:hypothetical protein